LIFLRTDDDRLGAKNPQKETPKRTGILLDATLAGNATGYHDTAVVPGTSYRYRISTTTSTATG
jgi:hypothetical protein